MLAVASTALIAERVRFAPSPTGFLHLGGLRTALYNYLLARQTGGQFIVRIEDTDQSRTVPGAATALLETLQWAGLQWDGTPSVQSERLAIYRQAVEKLVKEGWAYRCDCPPRKMGWDYNQKLGIQESSSISNGRYSGQCRDRRSTDPIASSHVIRFRVPREPSVTIVNDQVYGQSIGRHDLIDDIVLLKSDGYPTYHLANVVDDHLMEITTVMRGCEWLPSTPLHKLLYKAFGWQSPRFAHLPLLINLEDGSKLSKRQQAAFVNHYRQEGYFPEALVNFVALLGWTPKSSREILSLDELTEAFCLEDLHRNDAAVDLSKLQWFNRQYLRMFAASHQDSSRLQSVVEGMAQEFNASPNYCSQVLRLMASRISSVKEIGISCRYFFLQPPIPTEVRNWPLTNIDALRLLVDYMEKLDDNSTQQLHQMISAVSKQSKMTIGRLQELLRTVITGYQMGAPIVDTMVVIGREECLNRLHKVIEFINNPNKQ